MNNVVIYTDRLLIRNFTPDDVNAYFQLLLSMEKDKTIAQEISIADANAYLNTRMHDYSVYGFGRMACFERISSRLIGFSGLRYLNDIQEIDLGYTFLSDYWGKGFATESAQAILDYGHKRLGINRIIGLVSPENQASRNVLLKVGFSFERAVLIDDMFFDLYSIFRKK